MQETVRTATSRGKNIFPPEGQIQNEVIAGKECIKAVTMCIRKETLLRYCDFDKWIELGFPREDWPILFIISAYGDINYIPISTATYRVGQESISFGTGRSRNSGLW